MAYKIKSRDRSVKKALRRIAVEQIERAELEGHDADLTRGRKVHQIRKRVKKLRGALRLVRPAFADFAQENTEFRDIARLLAPYRDSDSMTGVYDLLCGEFAEEIDRSALAPVRKQLTMQKQAVAVEADIDAAIEDALDRLQAAGRRAANWKFSKKGFDLLAGGLVRTLEDGRRMLDRARKAPLGSAERDLAFHEWRKRVKDHVQHARLMADMWPEAMTEHISRTKALSDMLGRHHDLAIFAQAMRDGDLGPSDAREKLRSLALSRQRTIEEDAFSLGARLFAEKPKSVAKRWEALWHIWMSELIPAERKHASEGNDETQAMNATGLVKGWFAPGQNAPAR